MGIVHLDKAGAEESMTLPGDKAMGCLLPPPSVKLCCLCPPSPRSSPSWTKCLQPTEEAAHLAPDSHNPHPAAKTGDRHCSLPLLTPYVPPLPLPGPANRTLLVAIASINPWTSSLTSPQAPATSPLTSPRLTSVASTLPTWPGTVP